MALIRPPQLQGAENQGRSGLKAWAQPAHQHWALKEHPLPSRGCPLLGSRERDIRGHSLAELGMTAGKTLYNLQPNLVNMHSEGLKDTASSPCLSLLDYGHLRDWQEQAHREHSSPGNTQLKEGAPNTGPLNYACPLVMAVLHPSVHLFTPLVMLLIAPPTIKSLLPWGCPLSAPGKSVCSSLCLFSLLHRLVSQSGTDVSPLLQFLFSLSSSCTPPLLPLSFSCNTLQSGYWNSGPQISSMGLEMQTLRLHPRLAGTEPAFQQDPRVTCMHFSNYRVIWVNWSRKYRQARRKETLPPAEC